MVLTNVVQVFEDEDHSEMILDTCNVGAILILMDSTKGVHAYWIYMQVLLMKRIFWTELLYSWDCDRTRDHFWFFWRHMGYNKILWYDNVSACNSRSCWLKGCHLIGKHKSSRSSFLRLSVIIIFSRNLRFWTLCGVIFHVHQKRKKALWVYSGHRSQKNFSTLWPGQKKA